MLHIQPQRLGAMPSSRPGVRGGGGASGIANDVTPASGFAANSLIGASGNVVTSLPSANNALLATNSSGVAAYATTLNNGFTFAPPINTTGLTVSGYSLTGANAQALESLSGQWNTTGNPTAFSLSIIDTADGGSAYLMNLLGGTSGTTSEFKVSTAAGDLVLAFIMIAIVVRAGGIIIKRILGCR